MIRLRHGLGGQESSGTMRLLVCRAAGLWAGTMGSQNVNTREWQLQCLIVSSIWT